MVTCAVLHMRVNTLGEDMSCICPGHILGQWGFTSIDVFTVLVLLSVNNYLNSMIGSWSTMFFDCAIVSEMCVLLIAES